MPPGIHTKGMGTSPKSLRRHPCSFNHESETRHGIEYSPPCPWQARWNPRHRLHRRTNPWHVSQTLMTSSSRPPPEKLARTGSPHVCMQGSGPSPSSRRGGSRLAAHTRLALRSLASRASFRFRTPRRSLARVIAFTPVVLHLQFPVYRPVIKESKAGHGAYGGSIATNYLRRPPQQNAHASPMMRHTSQPVSATPLRNFIGPSPLTPMRSANSSHDGLAS